MKKMAIRVMILLLCAVMLLGLVMPALAVQADASEVTGERDPSLRKIRTVEDLKAIAENPSGTYILENDIDMTGVEWEPIDFSGSFDGGGHALLNLPLRNPGETVETAYDGNRKAYDVKFVGLFGTLKDAEVKNLKLMGVDCNVETDESVFVGSIAGYCFNSTVSDCTVYGNMTMRAHNKIFGLGGVVGYGLGSIDNCDVDVVMTLTDTNKETLDEQFLGGAYATGFIDVRNSKIKIMAVASEYGYAHTGGIVGMLMQYPIGEGKRLQITGNSVNGMITFFECNKDRRAYCAPFAGEVLAVSYNISQNLRYFTRNEIWEYDEELRHCMCEEPDFEEWTVKSKCDFYGYTERECQRCGADTKFNYTMFEHTVTEWEVLDPPTPRSEGLSEGKCDLCAVTVQRTEPMLEEPETEPTTEPVEETEPVAEAPVMTQEAGSNVVSILYLILGIATVLLVGAAGYLAYILRKNEE